MPEPLSTWPNPATPQQSAEYTYDMLIALRTMASDRGQETLVALLGAAAVEARSLVHTAPAQPRRARTHP